MRKILFVLVMVSCVCSFSQAQHYTSRRKKSSSKTVRTDVIYDTPENQTDFTLRVKLASGTTENTAAASKTTNSGYTATAGVGFGLADFVTIYAEQEYSSLKYDYTNPTSQMKADGVGNTTIGIKGLSSDFVLIYYSVSYTGGVLNKPKYNYDTGTEAPVSERPSASLDLALGISDADISVGAMGSYSQFFENKASSTSGGATVDIKSGSGKGSIVGGFLQYNPGFTIGASYLQATINSYDLSGPTGPPIYTTTDYKYNFITGYVIVPVSDVELLLSYQKVDLTNPTGYTSTLAYTTIVNVMKKI